MYCVVCAQSFKSNKSKCAAMCEVFVLSAFCRKSHTVALGLLFKSSPQMTTGNRYYTCYLVDCNTNPCAPICKNFSVSAFSGTIICVSSANGLNPSGLQVSHKCILCKYLGYLSLHYTSYSTRQLQQKEQYFFLEFLSSISSFMEQSYACLYIF